MARRRRPTCLAVLCVAGIALAATAARAGCGDDDGLGLGAATSGDVVRIGRGSALTAAGMQGCGLALETRIGDRKLAIVNAELSRDWRLDDPFAGSDAPVRFSQAGVDLWRGRALRWTVRASSAETLPEERDQERMAGADATTRELGARGLAMTSILRTRDGRSEWLSELAGANNGAEQWGTASRQRLRATLLQGDALRLDGIARYQRAEPAFDGPASALERDRELRGGGLTARLDDWTLALDHYRSRDNLDGQADETNDWVGWTGTVRYSFGTTAAWAPREAAVVLNRAERATVSPGADDAVRRSDHAELKLTWPGPLVLRLEAAQHADTEAGQAAGTAEEVAIGVEGSRRIGDWRWFAASRVGHLAGEQGFENDSEDRLSLSLGAEALARFGLRLGLRAEAAEISPRGDAPYRDDSLQVRAHLRF